MMRDALKGKKAAMFLPLILLCSCSEQSTGPVGRPNEVPGASSSSPINRTEPSVRAIIAARDCEPPPCDDTGACARAMLSDVRNLQCEVDPSGAAARCAFQAVAQVGEGEGPRAYSFDLRRRDGDNWCIAG